MTLDERDHANLTDFLMRASHEQLRLVAGALARELLARRLPCDEAAFEVARALGRCHSMARAEPLSRPA